MNKKKEKYWIGEIPLPPELDSSGMDTKADLVLININSNSVEAMSPNEAKSRLIKYDKIIKRLNDILEKPIDKESEIYQKWVKYKRLREKLIIGISEFEAKTGQVLEKKVKRKTKRKGRTTLTQKRYNLIYDRFSNFKEKHISYTKKEIAKDISRHSYHDYQYTWETIYDIVMKKKWGK